MTSALFQHIRYRERFVNNQLTMCERRLPRIPDPQLRQGLQSRIDALPEQAQATLQRFDGLCHGHDYVIAAEPA